jgi:hypothetical protein
MRRSVSIYLALGMIVAAVAPTKAAVHSGKTHHPVSATQPGPQRVCDWVGIGGRSIYRCTTIQPQQQAYVEAAPHRGCDWVGPGGRAIYVCR